MNENFVTVHGVTLSYEEEGRLSFRSGDAYWKWRADEAPYIGGTDGEKTFFSEAAVKEIYPWKTGVGRGFRFVWSGWEKYPGLSLTGIAWVEITDGTVHLELVPMGETDKEWARIVWPCAMDFEGEGSTALAAMQGALIPNGFPQEMDQEGFYYSRCAYMPIWGQFRAEGGCAVIIETPWDGIYRVKHPMNGATTLYPAWVPSLGKVSYIRSMQLHFLKAGSDYNDLARVYRAYVNDLGHLVTLKQKAVGHPNLDKLIGSAIIHETAYVHIDPKSHYYDPEHPEHNDYTTPFSVRSAQLRKLAENGLEAGYLHLDGWGHGGYDNLHPDAPPPHEGSGGWEGLKELADTCDELGYLFGIHDQYRDYYLNAESYDPDMSVTRTDGTRPGECFWYGGAQEILCATQAPLYVERNFNEMRDHGIKLTGTYLDVFSVVELDECAHPWHPMTRKDCVEYRRRCFSKLMAKNILISSEEVVDWAMTDLVYCHHAPYWQEGYHLDGKLTGLGIPIPLFNLVYHDCVIIPWSNSVGGWGVPKEDDGFLHSLLNGGSLYLSIEADRPAIERHRVSREFQRKVAYLPMLRHSFVNGDLRRQRTEFEGGYAAEVDFTTGEYILTVPEE